MYSINVSAGYKYGWLCKSNHLTLIWRRLQRSFLTVLFVPLATHRCPKSSLRQLPQLVCLSQEGTYCCKCCKWNYILLHRTDKKTQTKQKNVFLCFSMTVPQYTGTTCTGPWPQPHPTIEGWTRSPTANQTISPNMRLISLMLPPANLLKKKTVSVVCSNVWVFAFAI